jgi:hypothetical protein
MKDLSRLPFEHVPLSAWVIADAVAEHPCCDVPEIEARRRAMSDESRREFADLAETRCRIAHEARAQWWVKLLRKADPRPEMYMWARHWLHSWLHDPAAFRRDATTR